MKSYVQRKRVSDLDVLLAYIESREYTDKNIWIYPYDILQEKHGCCFKVAYRAMERACDRGLIDWGITLRSGFIITEGYDLLEKNGYVFNRGSW